MGFNAEIADKNHQKISEAFQKAIPEDFIKFGLIPEFIGRVPVTVSLNALDRRGNDPHFERAKECTGKTVSETL